MRFLVFCVLLNRVIFHIAGIDVGTTIFGISAIFQTSKTVGTVGYFRMLCNVRLQVEELKRKKD